MQTNKWLQSVMCALKVVNRGHREIATRDKGQLREVWAGLFEKVTFEREKRPGYWQAGLTFTAELQGSPTEHNNFIESSLR